MVQNQAKLTCNDFSGLDLGRQPIHKRAWGEYYVSIMVSPPHKLDMEWGEFFQPG
jgi:hypothetical protein